MSLAADAPVLARLERFTAVFEQNAHTDSRISRPCGAPNVQTIDLTGIAGRTAAR